ncbi:MAG: hypothetical protein KatS3mg070_2251 [Meiothermus sp.]|uniref:cytoskeletal protein beta 5 n=1 Tax=Meiothermus sp. TaxID=1955249 RepID=UPI0021DC1EAD|nr:cytoskeletal protein beta 5 [Meiothermus sp.]GIW28888.1 MAG: hypothetical protein KatS3mg070_2251 [Meiothermus sp.]
MSAERLLDLQERRRLEGAIREALLRAEDLERVLSRALEALVALEKEDRALGTLYASVPWLGHRVLEEILREIGPRLEALCGPLRETLGEVLDEGG